MSSRSMTQAVRYLSYGSKAVTASSHLNLVIPLFYASLAAEVL